MKMDEEDGKKADLASFPIAIRGRSIEGVFDRGGASVFACVCACVRINASERGERERERQLTFVGRWPNEAGRLLLKSHSSPVVARRHRVSTVIEKGDATTEGGGEALQRLRPFVVTYAVTERTWIVCKLRSRTRGERVVVNHGDQVIVGTDRGGGGLICELGRVVPVRDPGK